LPTDFGFTGQRNDATIGLYDYHARWYDPYLNRFISADTIVPDPNNPQDFNRYAYVRNNPLRYIDPSGHQGDDELPWYKEAAVQWLQLAERLVRAPRKAYDNIRTALPNIGKDSEYALHPRTAEQFLEAVVRGLMPGGAMTSEEIEVRPGMAEKNARALRNTGGWFIETTGAALDTYAVAAPIAKGVTNAIWRALPKSVPIGATGDIGEEAIRMLGGESQRYFPTTIGKGGRYVDQFVDGIAYEAKVGYTTLEARIQLEIAKDVELIATGQIEGAAWVFYTSPVTGQIGPSAPLARALEEAGISCFLLPDLPLVMKPVP
jgi:RHS repeat-associated protein